MLLAGGVHVNYSQFYVLNDGSDQFPLLEEAFAGQVNGLCGARAGRSLFLMTGLYLGEVPVEVEFLTSEPTLESEWNEAVEASIVLTGTEMVVSGWAGESSHVVAVPAAGSYRVRYCVSGMEAGRRQVTTLNAPAPDRYRLQFWPAPAAPDTVHRLTTEVAEYWHQTVRGLPTPADPTQPTPTPTPMAAPPVGGPR